MLNKSQRIQILQWAGVGLLIVSLLPVLAHRLFLFSILQGYIITGVIVGLAYFGYKKSKEIWKW